MSFRDDYAADLCDERIAKVTLDKACRAYRAAHDRLTQMKMYADEFGVRLDDCRPVRHFEVVPGKPRRGNGRLIRHKVRTSAVISRRIKHWSLWGFQQHLPLTCLYIWVACVGTLRSHGWQTLAM